MEKEREVKGEQTIQGEGADGSMKQGDWLRDQEEESNYWPGERVCHTHERAIPIQETVEALDITEEGKWIRPSGHVHE